VQRIAEIASALALISLMLVFLFQEGRRRRPTRVLALASVLPGTIRASATQDWRRIALAATVAVVLALIPLWTGRWAGISSALGAQAARAQSNQPLDLTMDFDRMPYLHHNPTGVLFAGAAKLTHYELSSQTLRAGNILTITAHWDGVSHENIVARASIVSPAQHLFGVPLIIASDDQPLVGSTSRHTLRIPSTTMRGVYLCAVQLYKDGQHIRPVNARGETLGTTYLMPVWVHNLDLANGVEPTLAAFGDRITLSAVNTVQPEPGTLEVSLTWRIQAPPRQNYKTALRLQDRAGREVARLDRQPGYGFLPTSMWRPGELVHDRYLLALDPGTPPGADYQLDVVLYEAATLRQIGRARAPDIAITLPTIRQEHPVLNQFGPALVLSEAQVAEGELEQGERLLLSLKWATKGPVEQDLACRVTLLGVAGTSIDYPAEPLAPGYPTTLWPKGVIVNQHFQLQLGPNAPPGVYSVSLSVIDAASGRQVDTGQLAHPVRIIETVRNFAIPQMQTDVGADFGGQVRLLGYDLERRDKELHLDLHWQALAAMVTDYKIFVHLFDPQTEAILSQLDQPAGGISYPTTRWTPGEVITDALKLQLGNVPGGSYRLAVGLYYSDERLQISGSPNLAVSADRLLLSDSLKVP
jgi:hypothetical protein